MPEPWATRLVTRAAARSWSTRRRCGPSGKFVTTHLIVRTKFLEDHPDVVEQLLKGHLEAIDYVNDNAAEAQAAVNAGITPITGKPLAAAVLTASWANLDVHRRPDRRVAGRRAPTDAVELGLLEKADLRASTT